MEAKDDSLPLFERIKFLSIYSSNLEEFYRIRVSEHRQALIDKKLTREQQESALFTLKHIDQEVKRQLTEFDSFLRMTFCRNLQVIRFCFIMIVMLRVSIRTL
jgi:Polyphosphate kinase